MADPTRPGRGSDVRAQSASDHATNVSTGCWPEPDPSLGDAALIAELREAFTSDPDSVVSELCIARAPAPSDCGEDGGGSASISGPSSLAAGARVGDFEILAEIGRGGMGIVYRARQISLQRDVALKILPNWSRHRHRAARRFRAEAQAAARLHHTNVVSIYSQGECGDRYYYAMELVDGVSLDAIIRGRPDLLSSSRGATSVSPTQAGSSSAAALPTAAEPTQPTAPGEDDAPDCAWPTSWTRADFQHIARLVAEIGDALHCAHQRGIIHRDVKPHNLLLSTDDHLHLTDFGLARLADEPHLTLSGEILGTPAYLSPEQIRGDSSAIDHRTDIYSLGVTLYELVTGRKPFAGETRDQMLSAICRTEPVKPRRLNRCIPIDLQTICMRAMEREPARRYPSAALLAEDLRRFADGRPILSRRPTWLEAGARWVLRRKLAATAVAASAAVLVLAAGLAGTVASQRHAEAQRLLQRAYEQLAYFDFHQSDLVREQIDQAAALGADSHQVELVRALAASGIKDHVRAIELLKSVLSANPADQRALYLLVWACSRTRQVSEANAAYAAAERLGPPTTADVWFFRGLATHYSDPLTAVTSYREANKLRARERGYYPQAILHLARARNQQLYNTRSLVFFNEALTDLQGLIDHGYYGSKPYYLLSISYRLAAEINSSLRSEALVSDLYAQALQWARAGQQVEPASDRPITAEAECLESMGDYEAACEARTRAIEATTIADDRCEGYHYRWRLYYWTGRPQETLADVSVLATLDGRSTLYNALFPALLEAEMGHQGEAAELAQRLADQHPASAASLIWSATILRLLGRAAEASDLLESHAAGVDFALDLNAAQSPEWMRALYELSRGTASLEELDTLAECSPNAPKLWGEAAFHAAAIRLSRGELEQARALLVRSYRSFDAEDRYSYCARTLLVKMEAEPSWPPWLRHDAD
jgi:serine/threonine protein kinase